MLVLFETPAGYSLFKVMDEKKLLKTDASEIHDKFFSSAEKAASFVQMVSFEAFADTADAVAAATAVIEGKVTSSLQSFLQSKLKKQKDNQLAVADKTLAVSLKEESILKSNLSLVHDKKTHEIFRGLRNYMDELFGQNDIAKEDIRAMQLGLSHSLGRYKLKFSADKVDTMVIQAVGLLDELDKEINTYAMRVKEWYGWHFPELQALVSDNSAYSRLVTTCGMRTNYAEADLSEIVTDTSVESAVKEAAELSMGTDITELDVLNIRSLAEQVISMTEYRAQLFEYLKNRMNAIAPNLTILVGELVGARLISHAGSLMNLAKQPASTVQILGAEKALFRALKTKHDTPKYGLIYHASLIGQAAPKHKGKISRVLAAKAALAIRVDALTEDTNDDLDTTIGYEGRAKVEARLRQLEGGAVVTNGADMTASKTNRYSATAAKAAVAAPAYNAASDMALDAPEDDDKPKKKKKSKEEKKEKKKRKADEVDNEDAVEESAKKSKKAKKEKKKKSSK